MRRAGCVARAVVPAWDGVAVAGALLWCIVAAALALAAVGPARAQAGAGAYDALAGIGHSRGAILDQVETLGGLGGGPGDAPPRGIEVIGPERRELTGAGARVLLIDAPFTLSWRAASGDFAIAVRRLAEPDAAGSPGRRGDDGRIGTRTVVNLMQSVRTARPTGDGAPVERLGAGQGRIRQTAPGRYEIRIDTPGPWRLNIGGR
ncbi:MAG: hypothetical protein RQ752_00395 [Thermohalobaculum sp.]|nr:hypothetical protein [Thermohalobaculum sp.]